MTEQRSTRHTMPDLTAPAGRTAMNTQNESGRKVATLNRRSFLAKGLAFVAVGSLMPAAFVRAVSAEELGDFRALRPGAGRVRW